MSRKYTFAQELCIRSAGKLSQQTNMLLPGARVGVAVSGGMDSWALLQVLCIRQGIVPFPFSLTALHINPGFDRHNHAPLADWLESNGVAGHLEITDHGLRAHSPENRKASACFFCAMQRRKRLFALCRQYNLTHLAFGHTADDLVNTFFMNMTQNGRVDGMSICEPFFKGKLMVIRPLLFVDKSVIAKAVKAWGLPLWNNPCPSAGHTRRSMIAADLEALWQGKKMLRRNTINALCRWQLRLTESRVRDNQ